MMVKYIWLLYIWLLNTDEQFTFLVYSDFLYLLTNFYLQCTLSDIKIDISICFWFSFAWWIEYQPSTFRPWVSAFASEVCFLDTTDNWILFCKPTNQFASFHWWPGPFIVKVIIERCLLIPVILLVIYLVDWVVIVLLLIL